MLGDKEREVLNQALEKYQPGRSEPIFIGGASSLKPALQLMNVYRLRIDEIRGGTAVTSYTRWLQTVIVKGTDNQEMFVTFSPRFERIIGRASLSEYQNHSVASMGVSKKCDQDCGRQWNNRPPDQSPCSAPAWKYSPSCNVRGFSPQVPGEHLRREQVAENGQNGRAQSGIHF
jgi:hypothetical protein